MSDSTYEAQSQQGLEEQSQLEEKVIKIIEETLSPRTKKMSITLDTKFKEDLKADSLEVYEVVYKLEQELNITIPESEANDVETVGDVVKLIRSRPTK